MWIAAMKNLREARMKMVGRRVIVCGIALILVGCAHNVGSNHVLRDGAGIAVLDVRTMGCSYYVSLKPAKVFAANKSDEPWKVLELGSGPNCITMINDKYGKGLVVVTVRSVSNIGCFDVEPNKINIIDTLEVSPGLTNLTVRENYDDAIAYLKNRYPRLLEKYETVNKALMPMKAATP